MMVHGGYDQKVVLRTETGNRILPITIPVLESISHIPDLVTLETEFLVQFPESEVEFIGNPAGKHWILNFRKFIA